MREGGKTEEWVGAKQDLSHPFRIVDSWAAGEPHTRTMDFHSAAEAQLDYDGSQIFRNFANYVGLSVDLVSIASECHHRFICFFVGFVYGNGQPTMTTTFNALVRAAICVLRNGNI